MMFCAHRKLFQAHYAQPGLLPEEKSHPVLEGERAQDLSHRICGEIFKSSSSDSPSSSFDYQVDISSASSHVVVAALRARGLAPPTLEGGEKSIGSRSSYDIYRDPNPKEAMVFRFFSFFFLSFLTFCFRFHLPSFVLLKSVPLSFWRNGLTTLSLFNFNAFPRAFLVPLPRPLS